MKEKLSGKAEDVRFTDKLGKSAVCLSADGEISLEMEKTFKSMKATSPVPVEAKKVLEINLNHPVAEKLKTLFESDKDKLEKRKGALGRSSAACRFRPRRRVRIYFSCKRVDVII